MIAQFEICEDVPNRMVEARNEQLASFSAGNTLLENTKDLLLIVVTCLFVTCWDRFDQSMRTIMTNFSTLQIL